MKNKMKLKKIIVIAFCVILTFTNTYSNESFTFDISEIEILNEGNKFIGKNGGSAITENGVTINAKNFEYDKLKNILYADTNVKIVDKLNDTTIFTEKITYLKNDEIVFTENKSKLIKENIIIDAKSFKYNRNLNNFLAKGNVKINDNKNNYFAESEEIIYSINENKITSSGETKAFIQSKYKFYGKNITILRDKQELFSKYKSKIVDNNLTQYEFDQYVYFFKKQLLKAKNITVISDNSVAAGETDTAKFKDGFFDLNNKNYKASDTSVKIKKNSFDNSKNDPRIKGVSSESKNGISKINKAIFTSCEIKNDNCPPWSIKAKRIIHDKNKKQLIYDKAVLQIYNKPVMYFPKFFHPDPSVDRQSGFLRPQLNNSEILGSSLNMPYFHIISENKDITLKPTIFDSNIQMYQAEYRQENSDSFFIADFNFVKGYESTTLNKKSSLTHLFSKYDLDLKIENYVNSFLSIFVEKLNNDTYLKVFDTNLFNIDKKIKPKSNSTLHSGIKLELDNNDFNFSAGMDLFEDLTLGKSSDKYEYILPYFNFSKNIFSNQIGIIDFISSGSNKLSETNNLRSPVINDVKISSYDFYSKRGFRNDINFYFKNLNSLGKNDVKYKNRPSMELASIYEASTSLPLKKINENSSEYLEPKISFRVNPGDMQDNSSNKRIINTDNIFDINRIGSNDTFESGKSLTLGINYKKEANKTKNLTTNDINNFFEFSAATVFRDSSEKFMPTSSTLNKKNSNLFGSIKNHYYSNDESNLFESLKFDYYFSLDDKLENLEYNSLIGELSLNKLTTSFNLIEEKGPIGSTSTIENSFIYQFDELNYLSFSTRRNKKISLTEYYDLLYEYKNDCLTAGIKYKKTYYQDRDLKPTEDLMLTFTFYPLTTYEQEIDQSLYRN